MRSNYLAKVTLLAALYIITGKLGLLLAVPPHDLQRRPLLQAQSGKVVSDQGED